MRNPFGRELGARAQPGPFVQGTEAFLHKAVARALNGGDARAYSLGNLFIGQLLVSFQQNQSPPQFAASGFPTATEP
jgi:hypothetical protein